MNIIALLTNMPEHIGSFEKWPVESMKAHWEKYFNFESDSKEEEFFLTKERESRTYDPIIVYEREEETYYELIFVKDLPYGQNEEGWLNALGEKEIHQFMVTRYDWSNREEEYEQDFDFTLTLQATNFKEALFQFAHLLACRS